MSSLFAKEYLQSNATGRQEGLAILFFCISVVTLLVARSAMAGGFSVSLSPALVIVACISWLSVTSLTLLFQEKRLAWYSFGAVGVGALAIFFSSGATLLAAIILTAGLFDAARRANDEKKLIVEFRPYRIMRRALPTLLLALSLFTAIGYVNTALADDFKDDIRIPRPLFDVLFTPIETGLGALIPSYHEGLSVSGTQSAIARDIFRPEALERFGVNAIFKTIEQHDGQAIPLRDAVYDSLNTSLMNAAAPYKEMLPFIAIIGFFFVFRFLYFLLMWVAIGITMLAVKVLVLYNIVSIEERKITQEQAQLG